MLKLRTISILLATSGVITWLAGTPTSAQSPVANFYSGKSVNLIVGNAVGGGTDNYARLLARHMSRYIPGNPSIIVQNMPGASSGKLASYLSAQAPKDGSVIGALDASVILRPLLSDQGLPFDPSKFAYLGSASSDAYFCIVRADAPVTTFQEALSQPIILGTTAVGSRAHDFPAMVNNVLGTKFRLVAGYAGTRELSLAIENREVQGMCGLSWSTLTAQHPDWLARGFVRVFVQEDMNGRPELNRMGVPLAITFARTEDERRIMELFYSQNLFGRPLAAPQGVPADRLAALRAAFVSVTGARELLADAAKVGLDIGPVSGDDVQSVVAKLYGFPANIIERAKWAVVYRPPT
jgi:tripartite-type tricarboxylate transporter receptor subunit TctC